MSNDMMNRVWWRKDLKTMEKFVALALADIADDDGEAYPSIETISIKCSCVRRTVQNALRGLESKGLVRSFFRKDRTTRYQMVPSKWPLVEKPKSKKKEIQYTRAEWLALQKVRDEEPSLFDADPTGAFNSDDGNEGVHIIPEGVHLTTPTDAEYAPNTLEETSEETSEESCVDVVASLSDFIKTEWDKLKAAYPNMGECRKVLPTQLELARERAQQHRVDNQTDIDVWREVFAKIATSRFQTGRVAPTKGRNRYKLTLSELLKTHIFRETINGKYISVDADEGSYDPRTGEIVGPARAAARSTFERFQQARERGGFGGGEEGAGGD